MFTSTFYNICYVLWALYVLKQAYYPHQEVSGSTIGNAIHHAGDMIITYIVWGFFAVTVFLFPVKIYIDMYGWFIGGVCCVGVPIMAAFWFADKFRAALWVYLPLLWVWFCYYGT